jgi:fluoride ion exporter CrcB/FEX
MSSDRLKHIIYISRRLTCTLNKIIVFFLNFIIECARCHDLANLIGRFLLTLVLVTRKTLMPWNRPKGSHKMSILFSGFEQVRTKVQYMNLSAIKLFEKGLMMMMMMMLLMMIIIIIIIIIIQDFVEYNDARIVCFIKFHKI